MLTAGLAGAVVDLTRQLVTFDSVSQAGLAQLRRYPIAVASAVGRFLEG